MSSQVPIPRAPPPPGMETYREKAIRKFKENPWVPLGCGATATALLVAMVKMRQGKSKQFNHWLRVRVVAQGLTLVAVCAGTWALRPKDKPITAPAVGGVHPVADRSSVDDGSAPGVASGELGLIPQGTTVSQAVSMMPRNEHDVERRRQEKVAREREEFEERLKEAEEQMKMEEAFKEGAKKRRENVTAGASGSKSIKSPHKTTGESIAQEAKKSTGSWLGWLGFGGGKKDNDGAS